MSKNPELLLLQQKVEAAMPYPAEEMDLTFRSMFGGVGAYVRGRFFASISDVGLALKFSPQDQDELLKQAPETKHLQYGPDAPISKQYLVVPELILHDATLLETWLKQSIDYVVTLPIKAKKKKTKE